MKNNKNLLIVFGLLIVISAIYRVIPFESRPVWLGAPQLAMALFAGSVIRNRNWAFALPLFSMLLSDLLMQGLYAAGATTTQGFYGGQWLNYLFIVLLTVVGFYINRKKLSHIAAGVIAAPTLFFLLSNFSVWAGGGGLHRSKTLGGLIQCYADGLPFYGYSLAGTAIFATVLFGTYSLITQNQREVVALKA